MAAATELAAYAEATAACERCRLAQGRTQVVFGSGSPTAELMFLLGAQLLYDGQAERALRFFDRAKELNQGEPLPLPAAEDKAADENKPPAQEVRVPLAPAPVPRPAPKARDEQPGLF